LLHGIFESNTIKEFEFLEYPTIEKKIEFPIDLISSKYHLMLMYSSSLVILEFPSDILISDPTEISMIKSIENCHFFIDTSSSMNVKDGIYFHDQNSIYEITTNNEHLEENDLWKLYLKKAISYDKDSSIENILLEFEKAERMSMKSLINYLDYLEIVSMEKCKFLFAIERYDEAMQLLIQFPSKFKEFLHLYLLKNQIQPLRKVLIKMLEFSNHTIFYIWIIELYLMEIIQIDEFSANELKQFLLKNQVNLISLI
jgi:hypothetical protein